MTIPDFGERAQVAIDFSGLNGPQLRTAMAAVGCELSKNHCYKLMRGEIDDPRFSTVAALIAATGVPSSWFFDPDIEGSATPTSLTRYILREERSTDLDHPNAARPQRVQGYQEAD